MSKRKKKPAGRTSGRTTAKGTTPEEKKAKTERPGPDLPNGPQQAELLGKVGRSKQRSFRPISHNRGNR